MNIIVMGPQGSGKGTQAELLVGKYNLAYFSPGEVLRRLAKQGGSLARQVDRTINKQGRLISDKLMLNIMDSYLAGKDIRKGILFDGFPRNVIQVKMLDDWLAKKGTKLDRVVYLLISRKESIKRLSARLSCPKCKSDFNLITMPPKRDEVCDYCQIALVRRADDQPEAITKRLEIFRKKTMPLIRVYESRGILEEVDGEKSVESIHRDIMRRLDQAEL